MARFAPLLLLALATLPMGALATNLTPSQVLANTQQLQGQKISVIGVISFLKAGTAEDGKPYQTFQLCDGGACIEVYTSDTDTYTEGKQLTATGVFWAVTHQGYHTYYNRLVLTD